MANRQDQLFGQVEFEVYFVRGLYCEIITKVL